MVGKRDLIYYSSNLYVGIDESNHGRFPEFFVCALSNFKKDTLESNSKFPKKRADHKRLFTNFINRDYSFLMAFQDDYARIPPKEFIGIVISSLLDNKINNELEKIILLIDGVLDLPRKLYIKDILSDIYSLERTRIKVFSGKDFDKKYKLVNLADEMAHYLFRNYNANRVSLNKHLTNFIK